MCSVTCWLIRIFEVRHEFESANAYERVRPHRSHDNRYKYVCERSSEIYQQHTYDYLEVDRTIAHHSWWAQFGDMGCTVFFWDVGKHRNRRVTWGQGSRPCFPSWRVRLFELFINGLEQPPPGHTYFSARLDVTPQVSLLLVWVSRVMED